MTLVFDVPAQETRLTLLIQAKDANPGVIPVLAADYAVPH